MEETIIFPSPNWFHTSGLAVTRDGWLIYGGPSKSLCFLQPLSPDINKGIILSNQRFQAHFVYRAHAEKIVSVDVSPLWPEKMNVLTGSADGAVKQWNLESVDRTFSIKSTHSHNTHFNDKEEVVGVSYSDETFGITLGVFGNLVKWDLNSNVVQVYNYFLKTYKPSCIACSRHIQLNVAVGTKQGVVFVLDLNGQGKLLYKVRAQDDEIINLSWCPQYEVVLRKTLKDSDTIPSAPESSSKSDKRPSASDESPSASDKRPSASDRMDKIRNIESEPENINKSGLVKDLPEDSFDNSILQEDDMFDIYKDHEADEFGHKKFEPVDVLVRVKDEKEPDDFLSECTKLKEEILKRKNEPEQSILSLVEALDKTHVENENVSNAKESGKNSLKKGCESSAHIQKHLLATIGKHGGVKIWSKSGKLVASCAVSPGNRIKKNNGPISVNLLWYKPDSLLLTDGKNQLLECNPLKINCKNKLEWHVVHTLHKRGLYGIATNAPRLQVAGQTNETSENWLVWTIAQDRDLICYSMTEKNNIGIYNTSGGFLYDVQSCPYDASKIAIAIGDGAVRVWEAEISDDDDSKLGYGKVSTYWHNVQGKVLTVAWHPTRENLLAFATGEARVGMIDTSGKNEKAAKTLIPALKAGVYSLCWGEGNDLYACGGGELVVYNVNKPDEEPVPVKIEFEGKPWEPCSVSWYPTMLLCGSVSGAVAVLTPDTRQVVTVSYVFSKMIHNMQMHPEQTANSNEESPYKNLIAVSSLERHYKIIILEYKSEGDNPTLQVWKTLEGHKGVVLQLAWSPHNDGQLSSTSQDGTVRIWDISDGSCTAIFGSHRQPALAATWSAEPARSNVLLSGGADCCLRAWDLRNHPPHLYTEIKQEVVSRKDKKRNRDKKKAEEVNLEESIEENKNQIAATLTKQKVPKKFLFPIINRQTAYCNIQSIKKLAKKFLENEDKEQENTDEAKEDEIDTDFLKMFGNTNDLNDILDMEMEKHLENKRIEAWIMLAIFRGRIMEMIDFSTSRDRLCPFLVSLTPGVSPKYWKDVMGLYLAQIDRLAANEDTDKTTYRNYGGSPYRRAAMQLAVHDPRAAIASLSQLRLYKEAYVIARVRHMGTVAESVLKEWAKDSEQTGNIPLAVVCHLALGDPYKASLELGRSNDQQFIKLASDLAKVVGQHTFANHLADKTTQIQNGTPEPEPEEDLKPLPTRMELLQIKSESDDIDN